MSCEFNSIDEMIDYFKNKAHLSFLYEYDSNILVNFDNFINNGVFPNKEIYRYCIIFNRYF